MAMVCTLLSPTAFAVKVVVVPPDVVTSTVVEVLPASMSIKPMEKTSSIGFKKSKLIIPPPALSSQAFLFDS